MISAIERDIKPANLFVTNLGADYDFLKILDFGMVKAAVQEGDVHLTRDDAATGTPAFMAPEIVLGNELDGRADLYSLGSRVARVRHRPRLDLGEGRDRIPYPLTRSGHY